MFPPVQKPLFFLLRSRRFFEIFPSFKPSGGSDLPVLHSCWKSHSYKADLFIPHWLGLTVDCQGAFCDV